jgi:hypothetical protein
VSIFTVLPFTIEGEGQTATTVDHLNNEKKTIATVLMIYSRVPVY